MTIDRPLWKGAAGDALIPGFWDTKLRAQIGRDLRTQYERTVEEPLPERLAVLVKRIEERERAASAALDHAALDHGSP